ncbi:MAG: hypothetical protein K1X78_18420 [Verrucomicrobiaceae bacterium]|nr:hypothetical protein [Verrucomicrobiaceae bacterium]
MRKQYHFRQSERGLLAWDVDRLIRLAQHLPRIRVPLTAIRELDEPFWFSHGDIPTCRAVANHARLMDGADLSYAIILSADGGVMDGMHRVTKAAMLGHAAVDAVQFESDPEPDYVGIDPDELPYD